MDPLVAALPFLQAYQHYCDHHAPLREALGPQEIVGHALTYTGGDWGEAVALMRANAAEWPPEHPRRAAILEAIARAEATRAI